MNRMKIATASIVFMVIVTLFTGKLYTTNASNDQEQDELARRAHVPADFPIHPTDLPTTR